MILMMAGILLLVRIYDDLDHRVAIPLIIISAAITITHSITAFLWILILLSFVIWNVVIQPLAKSLPSWLQPLFTDRAERARVKGLYAPVTPLFIFMLVSTALWWTYYAVIMKKLLQISPIKSFASFSLSSALQVQRLSPAQGLGLLTPPWILELLSIRDRVFLGLLLAGIATILLHAVRPIDRYSPLRATSPGGIKTSPARQDDGGIDHNTVDVECRPRVLGILICAHRPIHLWSRPLVS